MSRPHFCVIDGRDAGALVVLRYMLPDCEDLAYALCEGG